MRNDGYRAVVTAILHSHTDTKDTDRCHHLLNHLRNIFKFSWDKHRKLLHECYKYRKFVLEVTAHDLGATENLQIFVESGKKTIQRTLNCDEMYKVELGHSRDVDIRCALVKMNGQSAKAVLRRNSLFRRVISDKSAENECIKGSSLHLDEPIKKTFTYKGRSYNAVMKLTCPKPNIEELPSLEFEDLLEFVRTIHEFEGSSYLPKIYDGELRSEESFAILHLTFIFYEFPPSLLKALVLSVFLVWDYNVAELTDVAVLNTLKSLQTVQEPGLATSSEEMSATMCHLYSCVTSSIDDHYENSIELSLFPPSNGQDISKLQQEFKTIASICVLPIWSEHPTLDPGHYLASKLDQLIVDSVKNWCDVKLKAPGLNAHELCTLIMDINKSLHTLHKTYCIYFNQFSIDYIKSALMTLDIPLKETTLRILKAETEHIISRGDETETLNCHDSELLHQFSSNTMYCFRALGNLRKIASKRSVVPPNLDDRESWFSECFVHWTICWRELCRERVEKAKSLEEDDVRRENEECPKPAGLYNFLVVQTTLSEDVVMLELEDSNNVVLITLKAIYILCENLRDYARKLYVESKVGLVDEKGVFNPMPASTSAAYCRCVRAVNGIDHAWYFLEETWEKYVDWPRVQSIVSPSELDHVSASVESMLRSYKSQIDVFADKIVDRICAKRREMTVQLARQLCLDGKEYRKTLASYVRDRIDASLHNMDNVLEKMVKIKEELRSELNELRFKRACRQLHACFEHEVAKSLKDYQLHEYYRRIYDGMRFAREIFESPRVQSEFYQTLHLKSQSTEDLILQYYGELVDIGDRTWEGPSVCLQTAYFCEECSIRQDCDDQLVFLINVRDARLSSMNPTSPVSGRSIQNQDVVCKLELLPKNIFPENKFPPTATRAVPGTSEPKFNQGFKISIPQTSFFTYGATLCVSLLHHDRFGCDRMIGRAFVALNKVSDTEPGSRTSAPRLMHPLLPPSAGSKLAAFTVLRDRSVYDPLAQVFWQRERIARELQLGLRHLKHMPRRISSLKRYSSEKIQKRYTRLTEMTSLRSLTT